MLGDTIRAYKALDKMDKFLKGTKRIATYTNDEMMYNEACESLALNMKLRRIIWRKPKMATDLLIDMTSKGFI